MVRCLLVHAFTQKNRPTLEKNAIPKKLAYTVLGTEPVPANHYDQDVKKLFGCQIKR